MSRMNRNANSNANLKNKSTSSISQNCQNNLAEYAKFLNEKWSSGERYSQDGLTFYTEKQPLAKKVKLLNIDRWLDEQRNMQKSSKR